MADVLCYHCGEKCSPQETIQEEFKGTLRNFCCTGCVFACQLIHDAGEESYYKKRTAFPSSERSKNKVLKKKDLEKALSYDLQAISDLYVQKLHPDNFRIHFFIEGIHCSSCVFINEKILSWTKGINRAMVNYETGRAVVDFNPEIIRISEIISVIQSIGYNAQPVKPDQNSDRLYVQGQDLLRRLVVAGFFAGNTMMSAMAAWLGFFDKSMPEEYFHLFHWLTFILSTPVFIYSADLFHRGWKVFIKSGLMGMDLLISAGISIAYFYSVYATLYKAGPVYFDTVTTIVFFLLIGRYLEWKARYDQRMKMLSLIQPPQEYCFRLDDGQKRIQIPVSELKRNDTVIALPEDILPADGIVSGNECEMDESVLTGESRAVLRKFGDRVLAGSRVISGELVYTADTLPEESSLNVLADLARTSGSNQSEIEKITLRIVPWFSLLIFTVAGLAFIINEYFLLKSSSESLMASISVLIISCPCALALSVPTAVGSGIFLGLKKGILIRDGGVMEKIVKVKNYFFDKTGTLTTGKPAVQDAEFLYEKDSAAEIIYEMEYGSSHPSGRSIKSYLEKNFTGISRTKPDLNASVSILPGRGLEYEKKGILYRLGTENFITEAQSSGDERIIQFIEKNTNHSNLFFSMDGKICAMFALRDEVHASSRPAVEELSRNHEVYMLTGDSKRSAYSVAQELGIQKNHVFSEMLPEEKKKRIEEISRNETSCMVGDGYNDSVALSAADVSVVLSRGAPLSLEYAQVILLQNDPADILTAKKIAERTMKTIRMNLTFSLLYNFVAIPFAAAGYLLPVWCAVFMSVSSLTVVGSSIYFRWRGV